MTSLSTSWHHMAAVWLFIIPFALGMLALEELRKWFVRARPTPARTQKTQGESGT